ncbi:uncharacterized protein LOC119163861 isoform X1 [Rhipicephalus microplus]|uniref:uncharacterized protein LOC119163861 isoform X1 n=1 Tax=Rhipicephalus microplus TaxID=6941 RepID=UPI003F6C9E44
MFTNIDFRGVARGPCTYSNCECDSYERSDSCDANTSQNATLQCGWCCYCGHPPVSHRRIDNVDHSHFQPACLALEAAPSPPPLPLLMDGTEISVEPPLLEEDMQVVENVNIKTEPEPASEEGLQVGQAFSWHRQPIFAAVRFLNDKSVAVVPLEWIKGSQCMWPHFLSSSDIAEAAQRADSPDSSFIRRNVQVLKLTYSYDRAHTWLQRETEGSLEALTDEVVCHIKFPRVSSPAARDDESRFKDWPHEQSSPGNGVGSASLLEAKKNACSPEHRVWIHRLSSSDECTQLTSFVVDGNDTTDGPCALDLHNRRNLLPVCSSRIAVCSEGKSHATPKDDVTDTSATLSDNASPMSVENGYQCSQKSARHFSATTLAELEEGGEMVNGSSIEGKGTLSVILKELRAIRQQNQQILAALGKSNQRDSMELAKVKLPVTDLYSLYELESKLALDPVFRTCLVHRLSLIGGPDLRIFTAGVLSFLLTNAMGENFSMLGQCHKKRLKDMVLYDVVEQAIRSNDLYKNATSCSIQKAAAAWLKNCPSRIMADKRKLEEDANDSSSCD